MTWLVWLGLICAIAGGGLFAVGVRHNPRLALMVPSAVAVLVVVLLFLILSERPSGRPPSDAAPEETTEPPAAASSPDDRAEPIPPPAEIVLPDPQAPVNLLSIINPARHQLNGQWKLENGALISPALRTGVPAKLSIPIRPPGTFQLTAVVERLEGHDSISFGFPVAGRDVMATVDGYQGIYSGLNLIDGRTADRNESRRRGPFLPHGQTNTIVCIVGQNTVQLRVNGKTAIDWRGDVRRLSQDNRWPNGPSGTLQIGCWESSFRITKLEIKPLQSQP